MKNEFRPMPLVPTITQFSIRLEDPFEVMPKPTLLRNIVFDTCIGCTRAMLSPPSPFRLMLERWICELPAEARMMPVPELPSTSTWSISNELFVMPVETGAEIPVRSPVRVPF